MIRNYFKTAWRSLLKSGAYSTINVLGLSTGMAVVMLISLWIHDELTFNKCHDNYNNLGRIMTTATINGEVSTGPAIAIPLAAELRTKYGSYFKDITLASWNMDHILTKDDVKLSRNGMWVEKGFPAMFGLKMIKGSLNGLQNPGSILLSESTAEALFGKEDPVNKTIKVNNELTMNVSGVYRNLPHNATLKEANFFASWDTYVNRMDWLRDAQTNWGNHSFQLFVLLNKKDEFAKISSLIKDVPMQHLREAEDGRESITVHRMCDWHLYSDYKNGKIAGGRIRYIWLFGLIGFFVLLLACINFMNLATARSEKRAREVGIRKTVGSLRKQLIGQFIAESMLVACCSLAISVLLVQLSLPWFNQLADKEMSILWAEQNFWLGCLSFTLLTGLLAGSYPAFYLSSFDPIKVLKGTFKAGKLAVLPRKILVVLQFSVSVILIICTIVVFNQIQHARNRPVGYTREGLLMFAMNTNDLQGHYDAFRNELLKTGAVHEIGQSSSPTTNVWANQIGFDWKGKDPASLPVFGTIAVSHDFGKAIGWQIKQGRDFSRDFATDSLGLILNESAVKLTGFTKPVGENIKWNDRTYTIIGVISDMVMESPYNPVKPTIFLLDYSWFSFMNIRINPGMDVKTALARIEPVYKKYNPSAPFDYKFTDLEYARKFESEERIGKLAGFFAFLAIFISCLGMFGLASFMASQRTKEIGVRKVLGASVFNIWGLLSKDFLGLVFISFVIAAPLSYLFMHNWLNDFEYRTSLSWWIFALSLVGAILITAATVSFQAIRAALLNPSRSLRTE